MDNNNNEKKKERKKYMYTTCILGRTYFVERSIHYRGPAEGWHRS